MPPNELEKIGMSNKYPKPPKQELIARMNDGLTQFLAFIDEFSEEQMLEPKDAVGWNVRDHITHLAAWAEGIAALMRREDRWAAMGISEEIAQSHAFDQMNEAIVVQHRHLSPLEARSWLVAAHERVVAALAPLTDADLELTYDRFVAPFTSDGGRPVWNYVAGNSFGHYQEHTTWIGEIMDQPDKKI
jgi:hypothetical protein